MAVERGHWCSEKACWLSGAAETCPRCALPGGGVRAAFDVDGTEEGFVLLVDRDEGRSVTNDAVGVVEVLQGLGYEGRRVLYRDTEGWWDELLVAGGRFAGFAPVGGRSRSEALTLARRRGPPL